MANARFVPIKHQTQPTHDSCITTCIAMLCEEDAQDTYALFHTALHKKEIDIPMILAKKGIRCIPQVAELGPELLGGELYLAVVPSCVTLGLNHMIIIDTRSGEVKVFDPAMGYGGVGGAMPYYVPRQSGPITNYKADEFPLMSYTILYEIVRQEPFHG